MTDDIRKRMMSNTVGWLMKTRGISYDEAKARFDRAMTAPASVQLPTWDEIDLMLDDERNSESMTCRSCGRTMVKWDAPGVQIGDQSIDGGGRCFGCLLRAENG